MGMQIKVIGDTGNSPNCNVVPEGRKTPSYSQEREEIVAALPSKGAGMLLTEVSNLHTLRGSEG